MSKSKYGKLFTNLIFFFISTFSTKLIGYILLPIYTSSMTTTEYGIADILISTNNLIYPILMLGMGSAVVRFCIKREQNPDLIFTSGAIVLTFMSVVSIGLVPIVRLFANYKEYGAFLPMLAFTVNCAHLLSCLCKATDRTKYVAKSNIAYGITLLVTALILVKYLKLGVRGYLWSYILADIASCIYYAVCIDVKKYINLKYKRSEYFNQIQQMLRYGVPILQNSLAWWITQMSDRYMVTYWHGNALNGLYSVAYKIPSIIKTFVNVFIQAWQLSTMQEYSKKDSEAFYNSVYRIYCVCCYILTAGLILIIKPLAVILFSNDFYEAWKYVPLLLIAATIGSQESFFSAFYLASGKTKEYFGASALGAIGNVVFNVLLIPKFSVTGASIATAISYFIVYLKRAFYAQKHMKLKIQLTKNFIAIFLLGIEAVLYTSESIRAIYANSGLIIVISLLVLVFAKEIVEMVSLFRTVLKKGLISVKDRRGNNSR